MAWTALPFDGNPRALLHDVARVGFPPPWAAGARRLCHAGMRQCAARVRAQELGVGPGRSRGP